MKKYVAALLAGIICFSLFACGTEPEVSDADPAAESSPSVPALDVPTALELIKADRELIDIYMNGSLFPIRSVREVTLGTARRFGVYEELVSFVNDVYYSEGGTPEFLASFPGVGPAAVSQAGRATKVFYHPGARYDDYVDESTVSVEPVSENTAVIRAVTLSGAEAALDCTYENGAWKLDKGLYRTLPPEPAADARFDYTGMGSLPAFKGRLLAVEIYFSDSDHKFDDDTENIVSDRIGEALSFLCDNAARYGDEVEVTRSRLYYEHKGSIGNRVYDLDLMLASSTIGSINRMVEDNFDVSQYDGYVVFACRSNGEVTAAMRYENSDNTAIYFTERVNVSLSSDPLSIARETLALIGATDFADNGDSYIPALFRIYFPDDVMLSPSPENASVSPLTAYISGMTDGLDPIFGVFAESPNENGGQNQDD